MHSLIPSFNIHLLRIGLCFREWRYTAEEKTVPIRLNEAPNLTAHPLSLTAFAFQTMDASLPLPGPSMFFGHLGFPGPILGLKKLPFLLPSPGLLTSIRRKGTIVRGQRGARER